MKKQIVTILIGLTIVVGVQDFYTKKNKQKVAKPSQYVILISIDGLNWDYIKNNTTNHLDSIMKNGVSTKKLTTSFPTLISPNNYAIATGLNPKNNGITADDFYNKKIKKYFKSNKYDSRFYMGEPIWVTAESQHIKTGSISWIGSNIKIKGYKSSYYKSEEPYNKATNSIIKWLEKPYIERPKLIIWNINNIYKTSEKHKSNSSEIKKSITNLDNTIGNFIKQINTLSIKDSVNIIITSGCSATNNNNKNIIYLNKYINKHQIDTILGNNPFLSFYVKNNYKDSVKNQLKKIKNITIWDKNEFKTQFKIKNGTRIADITILADSNIYLCKTNYDTINKNSCGYNNTFGVFYAIGPAFKKNYKTNSIYNTDIYNLITTILKVKPANNDGDEKRILNILK